MAKNINELFHKTMTPESRARARARADKMIAEMPLDQIRKTREMTQIEMAMRMKSKQASISKLEGRSDVRVSTLREYVQALGGKLVIRVEFPDQEKYNIVFEG